MRRNAERLFSWLDQQAEAKTFNAGGLRAALSQGQPGRWASDHREETNHFTGWNYVAIKLIAQQCAAADIACSIDRGDDEPEPLPKTHPLCRLMKRSSPTQSGASFRYEQAMQLSLTGTCLAWNVRNRLGLTIQRYVIPIAITSPVDPCREFPAGAYRVMPQATNAMVDQGFVELGGFRLGFGAILDARDVQTIRLPHPLFKDDGYGPLAAGSLWTDSADQIDRARWSQMKNGADPSLIVSPPDDVSVTEADLDRMAVKLNQKYAGPDKSKKIMLMSAGTEVTKLSQTPEEMAYETGFDQLRDAVMALHSVPAGMVNSPSYATLYAAIKQCTMFAVQPLLSLVAGEDTEQLAPEFGDGITVEMTAAAVDDPEMLERQLQTDAGMKIRTRNEVRALRGYDPDPGPAGDEYVGGSEAVNPTDQLGQQTTPGQQPKPQAADILAPFNDVPTVARKRLAITNGHSHAHNGNGHSRKKPWEWYP